MHRFVALKEQGNYSFVGRCKFGDANAIAKFTCETNLGIKHEYEALEAVQKYRWFPKCIGYCEDLMTFHNSLYTYDGNKEMMLIEDIGEKSITIYNFMKMKHRRKHVMDSTIVQTVGAICAMHKTNIVHNDMHTNNILVRPCSHDYVVYTNKKDYTVSACTPTYGVEPVIIDLGMAKHVRDDGLCALSEYHTHLGMSISGKDIDGRFDAATFLFNTLPVYERYNTNGDHLRSFVKGMLYDDKSARPCGPWFNSMNQAVWNTIPGKLMTEKNQFILVDAAFLARSTVPIRRYQDSNCDLHALWREMYAIMFPRGRNRSSHDPLKIIKDICVTLRSNGGRVWNRTSTIVKMMGKAMASLTVRINARVNKDKKKLYKTTYWQLPQEMLVVLSMMKTMQSKSIAKLAMLTNSAKVLVYEMDTNNMYYSPLGAWRTVINQYLMRCVQNQQNLVDTASMVAMISPSPSASEMAYNIVSTCENVNKHVARLEMYENLVLTCMYALIIMSRVWSVALKMLTVD